MGCCWKLSEVVNCPFERRQMMITRRGRRWEAINELTKGAKLSKPQPMAYGLPLGGFTLQTRATYRQSCIQCNAVKENTINQLTYKNQVPLVGYNVSNTDQYPVRVNRYLRGVVCPSIG